VEKDRLRKGFARIGRSIVIIPAKSIPFLSDLDICILDFTNTRRFDEMPYIFVLFAPIAARYVATTLIG
jgi:hypothetical protein